VIIAAVTGCGVIPDAALVVLKTTKETIFNMTY